MTHAHTQTHIHTYTQRQCHTCTDIDVGLVKTAQLRSSNFRSARQRWCGLEPWRQYVQKQKMAQTWLQACTSFNWHCIHFLLPPTSNCGKDENGHIHQRYNLIVQISTFKFHLLVYHVYIPTNIKLTWNYIQVHTGRGAVEDVASKTTHNPEVEQVHVYINKIIKTVLSRKTSGESTL